MAVDLAEAPLAPAAAEEPVVWVGQRAAAVQEQAAVEAAVAEVEAVEAVVAEEAAVVAEAAAEDVEDKQTIEEKQ